MSWDIYLRDEEGRSVTVERHQEGGTYALGGITEAELNVTYNYGKHFRFPCLDGLTGAEAGAILHEAIWRLGKDRDPDYWKPTEGNVRHACEILFAWANQNPTAKFEVS